MVNNPRLASILHISDLHFFNQLTEKGRKLWLNGLKSGLKTHSFAMIDGLSNKLFELTQYMGKSVDIVAATGDISTDGSSESLQTALEFLENTEIRRNGKFITRGLGMQSSKRLIVPGNHDRYGVTFFQTSSDQLEKVFSLEKSYPYVRAYRRNIEDPCLLFFVFDSTRCFKSYKFWKQIACGYIGEPECDWLVEKSEQIRKMSPVTFLDGTESPVNYDTAIKIALLHHDPVFNIIPRNFGERISQSLMTLENNEMFVDSCFSADINLVLFGHQHVKYPHIERKQSKIIHFFCCPSTSEVDQKEPNGFSLLHIYKDHCLEEFYLWQKSGIGNNKKGKFKDPEKPKEYRYLLSTAMNP